MRSPLHILLIAITAFGGVLLWRERQVVAPLRVDYARLSAKYRMFEVADPQDYHVAYVENGPMGFMWRCYLPQLDEIEHRVECGHLRKPNRELGEEMSEPITTFVNIAFSTEDDLFGFDSRFLGHRNEFPWFSAPKFDAFVREHWSELDRQVLGEDEEVHRFGPDEIVTLMSVSIPTDLHEELEAAVSAAQAKELLQGPILEVSFGTPAAFRQRDLAAGKVPLE